MTREQLIELARYTADVIRARNAYRTSEHGERRCEAMEAATGHAVYRHARPAPRFVIPTWNPNDIVLPTMPDRIWWAEPIRWTCKADQ